MVIVVFGDHNPWLGDGNAVYKAMGLDLDFSHRGGVLQLLLHPLPHLGQ